MSKKISVIVKAKFYEVGSHKSFLSVSGGNRRFICRNNDMATKKRYRPESDGSFKAAYKKNRRRVLEESDVCAICGMPIDRALRFPDPMSATVDHIIPIIKGGHPSDPANLQAAHLICNQMKASKLTIETNKNISAETALISNRDLPLSKNWIEY